MRFTKIAALVLLVSLFIGYAAPPAEEWLAAPVYSHSGSQRREPVNTYKKLLDAVNGNADLFKETFEIEISSRMDVSAALDKLVEEPFITFSSIEVYMEYYIDQWGNPIEASSYTYVFYVKYRDDIMVLQAFRDSSFEKRLNGTEKQTLAKAKAILRSIIKDDMTEYEKVLAVYEYLIKNAKYDIRIESGSIPDSSRRAEGVLLKGVGVCSSYSAAMNLLMGMLDIECVIVFGLAGVDPEPYVHHAWNKVKIDGNWYNIDVTWGDPVPDRKDAVCYYRFCMTDREFSQTHKWDAEVYPKATDTKYYYFRYFKNATMCCAH